MNESVTETTQDSPARQRVDALQAALESAFGDTAVGIERFRNELTLELTADRLLDTAARLRDEAPFVFEQLIDVCGVDYAAYGQDEWTTDAASLSGFGRGVERMDLSEPDPDRRFAAVYHLLSIKHNHRLRIRVRLDGEMPRAPSVIAVWNAADWFEREAFDLYGILFEGHPDLRRILTDYGFIGHPFRKDFPLIGQVEMRYDPEKRRVVYQPVSIEKRPNVPRVIRAQAGPGEEPQPPQDAADA